MPTSVILQERPFRSVRLEEHAGVRVVVKRLHHPGRLRGLFDGARARGEFRILAALHARGLPVPRPLEVRREERGFALRMEAVPGARSLDDWLALPAHHDPALLAELGRTLARFQDAGLRHHDLHPGNVLLDEGGRPFLIDFHRARIDPSPLPLELRERDLTTLAAATRERLARLPRRRFLVAWARASRAGDVSGLARRLEGAARRRRRADVLRGLDRWLRDSSRCRLEDGGQLVARTAGATPAAPVEGNASERRRSWRVSARLFEHRLPCLAPRRHGPLGTWLEAADGGRPLESVLTATDPAGDELARALGGLLGSLHDRGLGLRPGSAGAALNTRGGLLVLGPRTELVRVDRAAQAARELSALCQDLPGERARLLEEAWAETAPRYFS